jgi:iron(III) transport system permease protein
MSARRVSAVAVLLILLSAFFLVFLFYPLFYVLKGSVVWEGGWGLDFFGAVLRNPPLRDSIVNSLLLGVAVTLATTLISLPLALVTVRRDFVGRKWVNALIMLPLILPPFVGAIGMKQMFARMGSVNLLLEKIVGGLGRLFSQAGLTEGVWEMSPVDWLGASGFWGVVVIETLHLYPIMFLNVVASLASVDRSCEEAASNLGASGWNVFRRITFPLMLPGYFAGGSIVFIWSFTDVGTPLILKFRSLVPFQIFDMAKDPKQNATGFALVVIILAVTAAVFVGARALAGARLRSVTSRQSSAGAARRAGPLGSCLILLFVLGLTFVAVIPHIAVVLSSLTTPGGWQGSVLPGDWTLEQYAGIAAHKDALRGLGNSLIYSTLATAGTLVLGVVIAYLLTRERTPGGVLLDMTVMIPLALPGVILAYGYLTCFSDGPLDPFVNPAPLLVISYVVRRLPYMVRSAVAGFQHVSRSLEEASTGLGARLTTTFRRVTLPLVLASLAAGAVLTFVFSMFEVSQSLILAQEPAFFPVSRVLYELFGRVEDGPYLASAMGVIGMVVLGAGLLAAGAFLGRRLGDLFRS